MDTLELFQRLGLALAIGFLVGIERGWRERQEVEGGRTAGLRTFALSGLLGGIAALVGEALGGVVFAGVFLGFAGAVALFRWREAESEGDYGVTTVVAALLVFSLGAYALVGEMVVAAAAGVAAAVLLAFKSVLHEWLKRLTWPEIRSAAVLLAMTFVALPILPNRGIWRFDSLNPYEIWLMTVLIAAVSFAGYVATRLLGERGGVLATGVAGGLVASTAVTLDMARRSREDGADAALLAGGATLAGGVMFARVLAVAVVIDTSLLGALAPALGAGAVTAAGIGLACLRRRPAPPEGGGSTPLRNPLDLPTVLRFGALLSLVFVLAEVLRTWFGPSSVIWLAAAAGLADVDAVTLSMARDAGGAIPAQTAVLAILVVAASNSLSKSAIAAISGTTAFAWRFAAAMGACLAAGGLVHWIVPGAPLPMP